MLSHSALIRLQKFHATSIKSDKKVHWKMNSLEDCVSILFRRHFLLKNENHSPSFSREYLAYGVSRGNWYIVNGSDWRPHFASMLGHVHISYSSVTEIKWLPTRGYPRQRSNFQTNHLSLSLFLSLCNLITIFNYLVEDQRKSKKLFINRKDKWISLMEKP